MKNTNLLFVLLFTFFAIQSQAQTRVFIGANMLTGNSVKFQARLDTETKIGLNHGFMLGVSIGELDYMIYENRYQISSNIRYRDEALTLPVNYLIIPAGYNFYLSPRFYLRNFVQLKYKLNLNTRGEYYKPEYIDEINNGIAQWNLDAGMFLNYYLTNGIVIGIGPMLTNLLDAPAKTVDVSAGNYFLDGGTDIKVESFESVKRGSFYMVLNLQFKLFQVKTRAF